MGVRCSLVTGGAGFIGRHLVRLLRGRGEQVRVLDLERLSLDGVESIQGSILDRDTLRRALRGVDRVYHLAADPNLWASDKHHFDRVNHQGTRILLEEAARCDIERFVHTSTESILAGVGRRSDPMQTAIDGAHPLRLEDMPGPYCRSKYLAEQAALQACTQGLPVVVVNPTLPVGPEDIHITPPTRMLLGFLNRTTPAYLNSGFNLVDVRDVALGHFLAAERGRIGERYVLGGTNLMLGELLQMLRELTGIAMPRLRVPYCLALGAGLVSEFVADHLTRRPPVAPLAGVRLAASPMFFDSSKAKRELGFVPSPIRTALADAIEWLRETGALRLARK